MDNEIMSNELFTETPKKKIRLRYWLSLIVLLGASLGGYFAVGPYLATLPKPTIIQKSVAGKIVISCKSKDMEKLLQRYRLKNAEWLVERRYPGKKSAVPKGIVAQKSSQIESLFLYPAFVQKSEQIVFVTENTFQELSKSKDIKDERFFYYNNRQCFSFLREEIVGEDWVTLKLTLSSFVGNKVVNSNTILLPVKKKIRYCGLPPEKKLNEHDADFQTLKKHLIQKTCTLTAIHNAQGRLHKASYQNFDDAALSLCAVVTGYLVYSKPSAPIVRWQPIYARWKQVKRKHFSSYLGTRLLLELLASKQGEKICEGLKKNELNLILRTIKDRVKKRGINAKPETKYRLLYPFYVIKPTLELKKNLQGIANKNPLFALYEPYLNIRPQEVVEKKKEQSWYKIFEAEKPKKKFGFSQLLKEIDCWKPKFCKVFVVSDLRRDYFTARVLAEKKSKFLRHISLRALMYLKLSHWSALQKQPGFATNGQAWAILTLVLEH